jgi:transposase
VVEPGVSLTPSRVFHDECEIFPMISPETRAQIRRYFYAEHWKIGTIAHELGVHPDTVRNAIEAGRFRSTQPLRPSLVDPYAEFIRQTLDQHPRLRATRIYQMLRDRGYAGSVVQLRRAVARLRPSIREPFLRLQAFPGEQGQVDWAHFGHVMVGRARRALSCFVMTLSYSRALYLEFFFDQTTENFLRGHVHAFQAWNGQPRAILYDNLKAAVLERRGSQILFNPRLLELSAHYHFAPQPCQVRAGNQKGRVERAIRYVRDSFWAGRTFTTLAECNRQALAWRDQIAHQRRWPGEDGRTVEQVFAEEQPRLLPAPLHPFSSDRIETVRSHKTIYVRFDLNDYSIPPEAVGRSSSIIVRMSAIRKLAVEATDNGLLAPELAAGIQRVKSAKSIGVRKGELAVAEAGPGAAEHTGYLDAERPARPRHHRGAPRLRTAPVRSGGAHDGARAATRRAVGDPGFGLEAQTRPDGADADVDESGH